MKIWVSEKNWHITLGGTYGHGCGYNYGGGVGKGISNALVMQSRKGVMDNVVN